MVTVLEQIELTDTTTSYQVTHDHIDLDETLDESYARHRAAIEQAEQSQEDEIVVSNPLPVAVEKTR